MKEPAAMERALELALGGWGRVAPNPLVGAVILRDGEILGEGHHAEYGGAHAEAVALADVSDARGATCVVTLEPCAHHGHTPPCADALIERGVARVVIASRDPHEVSGDGVGRLRAAGVDVVVGVCGEQAAVQNAPYLFAATVPERPFVALKVATSLDGFLADDSGNSRWISGPPAREYVHWLRAGFDAIGVGRRTADLDDPLLTVRGPVEARVPPTRVIFSRGGPIRADLRMFADGSAPVTVVTSHDQASNPGEVFENKGVTFIGADGVGEALAELRRAGIRSILIEGGGMLGSELFERDLVDRLYWVQAPFWLGSGPTPFGRGPGVPLDSTNPWHVSERRGLGGDTLLVIDRKLCLLGS